MEKSKRNGNRKDMAESVHFRRHWNATLPKAMTFIATTEIIGFSLRHDRNHAVNEDIRLFYWCNSHSSLQKTLMTQGQPPSACTFLFNGLDKGCHPNSRPYIKRTLTIISFWIFMFSVTLIAKGCYQQFCKHKQLLGKAEISNRGSAGKRQNSGLGVDLQQCQDAGSRTHADYRHERRQFHSFTQKTQAEPWQFSSL